MSTDTEPTTDDRVRVRDGGAVLRLSESELAQLGAVDTAAGDTTALAEDETMFINMGPSHPSTHGVLRLMLELKGEMVVRSKPVIGYLHTGMEKQAEQLSYLQGTTNVTRMDYASPLFNE
ncbi:MAG: NADH dehydrogenase subunit D, partial [Acidimicrobiales bacterium]